MENKLFLSERNNCVRKTFIGENRFSDSGKKITVAHNDHNFFFVVAASQECATTFNLMCSHVRFQCITEFSLPCKLHLLHRKISFLFPGENELRWMNSIIYTWYLHLKFILQLHAHARSPLSKFCYMFESKSEVRTRNTIFSHQKYTI